MNIFIDGQNNSLAKSLLASWGAGPDKIPGWMMRQGTTRIVGKVPIGRAVHFKSAADRLKADAALEKLKSKGGKISGEEIGRILAPHTHVVPIWRGAEKATVARIMEILAAKKENTDAPPE